MQGSKNEGLNEIDSRIEGQQEIKEPLVEVVTEQQRIDGILKVVEEEIGSVETTESSLDSLSEYATNIVGLETEESGRLMTDTGVKSALEKNSMNMAELGASTKDEILGAASPLSAGVILDKPGTVSPEEGLPVMEAKEIPMLSPEELKRREDERRSLAKKILDNELTKRGIRYIPFVEPLQDTIKAVSGKGSEGEDLSKFERTIHVIGAGRGAIMDASGISFADKLSDDGLYLLRKIWERSRDANKKTADVNKK